MATFDATPPIVRFTLRVLDAQSTQEVAEVCAEDMVRRFGAPWAEVVEDDGRVIARCGRRYDGSIVMPYRLSGPDEPVTRLDVGIVPGPDAPIVRQQLIDLGSVARCAWRERRRYEVERSQARQDALTGLENRRAIEEVFEATFDDVRRRGVPLTVMIVDLDHFKAVNDSHGHSAGDDVLQLAAACFREHLRPTDRVCRWGGDEFLLVLPGLPAEAAVRVAERLRIAYQSHDRARGTTMTIGVADTSCLAAHEGARNLIELSDTMLYQAKRAGRDRVVQASRQRATG